MSGLSLETVLQGFQFLRDFLWLGGLMAAFGKWLRQLRRGSRTRAPSAETVKFVRHRNVNSWHMGKIGGKPAMRIASNWFATNITDGPIHLLDVFLADHDHHGRILTRHPQRNTYWLEGDADRSHYYPILPKTTSEVSIRFVVEPPIHPEGQEFTCDVVVVDQFANEHLIRGVRHPYR